MAGVESLLSTLMSIPDVGLPDTFVFTVVVLECHKYTETGYC